MAIRFGALGHTRDTDPTCDQWRWLSSKQYTEVVRAPHHALDVVIQTLGIPVGPLQVALVPLELGQTRQHAFRTFVLDLRLVSNEAEPGVSASPGVEGGRGVRKIFGNWTTW